MLKAWISSALMASMVLTPAVFAEQAIKTAELTEPAEGRVEKPAELPVAPAKTMPAAELPIEALIEITKNTIPLNSRLRKTYSGYALKVMNKSQVPLDVMGGEVMNGINGQSAYLATEKTSAAAIGATLGTGLVLGIVSFGITFLVALLASPFIYAGTHVGNNRAKSEGTGFTNQVSLGQVNPGDSFTVTTLMPVGQSPQLKLMLRNQHTGQFITVMR